MTELEILIAGHPITMSSLIDNSISQISILLVMLARHILSLVITQK